MWIRGVGQSLLVALLLVASVAGAAPADEARARYNEGVQALAERRYQDALVALREAVRLDPDFAGAWLDLAVVTYAVGDPIQAEELLDIVQQRFAVPAPLLDVIGDLRRQIAATLAPPPPAAVWRWRRQITTAAGYDSNANAGLSEGRITLTLPGGAVVLPVARLARPTADTFVEAGVAAAGSRRYTAGVLEFTVDARGRHNREVADFDTAELRAEAAWTSAQPLPAAGLWGALPGPWRVRAEFDQLRLDAHTLTDQVTLGAEHLWLRAGCRPRLALEVEWHRYPVARSFDATYLWLGGELRCPSPLGPGSRQLVLQVRGGEAFARHDGDSAHARPGGNSRHLELTTAHEWAWRGPTGTQTLRLLAQWERVRDDTGYSPLLANGARRRVDRGIVGLSWSVPLNADSDWRLVLSGQQFRQTTNLQPFELTGSIARIGLERYW